MKVYVRLINDPTIDVKNDLSKGQDCGYWYNYTYGIYSHY